MSIPYCRISTQVLSKTGGSLCNTSLVYVGATANEKWPTPQCMGVTTIIFPHICITVMHETAMFETTMCKLANKESVL
jgi:hypothetical protein